MPEVWWGIEPMTDSPELPYSVANCRASCEAHGIEKATPTQTSESKVQQALSWLYGEARTIKA
jgi:hypothetical protein